MAVWKTPDADMFNNLLLSFIAFESAHHSVTFQQQEYSFFFFFFSSSSSFFFFFFFFSFSF
jgi:hypothetical protein